jgi:hypothetical protein
VLLAPRGEECGAAVGGRGGGGGGLGATLHVELGALLPASVAQADVATLSFDRSPEMARDRARYAASTIVTLK